MSESRPTDYVVPAGNESAGTRPWVYGLAALLLLAHFCLALGGKRVASTTSDELVHLTAGFSYWQNHDYRLHPENGILPQRWAALPTWLQGARFPELADSVYWKTSDVWVLGCQFFYETGEDHFPRLQRGRAMIALFSVATGALVFFWTRRLFSDAGALIALTLFAFSPDFLAHGALVTSDVCMTFFFLAAVAAWWRHLHDPRGRFWWLSALTFGLAFVAKYSAVLLIPMMVILAVVRACSPEPLRFARWTFVSAPGKLGGAALSALGHAVVVWTVIWAFYGFRYSAFNPALPPADSFIRPWADYVGRTGTIGELTRAAASLHLLPEAFLYGFDYVLATSAIRAAFLNGDYSLTGWRTFFLWTFLLKSTIPVLLITVGLVVATLRGLFRSGLRRLYPFAPLLALFIVYGTASIASHLNIGHRHILPLYPVIFIGAGAAGAWLLGRAIARTALVGALLAWHVADAIWIAPYHLAFFNAIGGGPAQAWRHLVDSSLDWGQDLPTLKAWLDKNQGDQRAYLAYSGTSIPSYYRIRANITAPLNVFKFPPVYTRFEAGIYCISATILQQLYSPVRVWTPEREKEYQELRSLEPYFAAFSHDPRQRETLLQQSPVERWHTGIKRHDLLRMARLTTYLRARGPDASAGYSILIFRLTPEEVKMAVEGSFSEWYDAVQKAGAARR